MRPGVDKQPEVTAADVEAEAELDVAGNTLIPTYKYTKGIRLGREETYLGKNGNLARKQHYAQRTAHKWKPSQGYYGRNFIQ